MSIHRWFVEPVTRHPGLEGDEDDYGTPTVAFDDPEEYRGRLEPTDSLEVTRGRDTVVADWRLFLPFGTPATAHDQWEGRGLRFETVGAPAVRTAPGARLDHVEVLLRYVEG